MARPPMPESQDAEKHDELHVDRAGQHACDGDIRGPLAESEYSNAHPPEIMSALRDFQEQLASAYRPFEEVSTSYRQRLVQGHYQHQRLPTKSSIRLLDLHPARYYDDELRGELVITDLHAARGTYHAISYAIGEPSHTSMLYIGSLCLYITPTLAAALRRLRSTLVTRRFWVDAVCIDLKDPDEKSAQVTMMALIYFNARIVCIHLGSAPAVCEKSMDFFHELATRSYRAHQQGSEPDEPTEIIESVAVQTLGSNNLQPIGRFFQLEWFHRRWTFQELAHQNRDWTAFLFYGNSVCPWSDLSLSLKTLIEAAVFNSTQVQTVLEILQVSQHLASIVPRMLVSEGESNEGESKEDDERLGIVALLNTCHGLQCKDPRDSIYAMLSCGADVSGSLFRKSTFPLLHVPIDYRATVKEVFVDFARRTIACYHQLHILHCAGAFRAVDDQNKLPSWVPEWSVKRRFKPLLHSLMFWSGHTDVPLMETFPYVTDTLLDLHCWGTILDMIIDRSELVYQTLEAAYTPEYLKSWCTPLRRSGRLSGPAETTRVVLESFMKCVTADFAWLADVPPFSEVRNNIVEIPEHVERLEAELQTVRERQFELFLKILNASQEYNLDLPQLLLANNICNTMTGRCFFMTSKGYVGIGPRDLMPGDKVVLIETTRAPFVLRPLPHKDCHQLVGDAYLDGFMSRGTMDKYSHRCQAIRIR